MSVTFSQFNFHKNAITQCERTGPVQSSPIPYNHKKAFCTSVQTVSAVGIIALAHAFDFSINSSRHTAEVSPLLHVPIKFFHFQYSHSNVSFTCLYRSATELTQCISPTPCLNRLDYLLLSQHSFVLRRSFQRPSTLSTPFPLMCISLQHRSIYRRYSVCKIIAPPHRATTFPSPTLVTGNKALSN